MVEEQFDRPGCGLADDTRHAHGTRAETVRLLLGMAHAMHLDLCAVAAEHELTPAQIRAVLDMAGPAPMRDLAERLACDKSHITGLVDGLEQRGLVTRSPDPHDRRVKRLVLTPAGRALRDDLRVRLYAETPALANLGAAEEDHLRRLLRAALRPDA